MPGNDRRKDVWFERKRGITIIRLTNEQVFVGDFTVHDLCKQTAEPAPRAEPADNEICKLKRAIGLGAFGSDPASRVYLAYR